MLKKEIRQFNISCLNTLLNRDNATLVGEYSQLHGGIKITFRCVCNIEYSKLFRDIAYYGGAFCKECTKKNKGNKIRKTCIKLYGVENPSQLEEVKKKKEETYMEHYGDHPKRTQEVKQKYINTCLEKYGFINSAQTEKVKKKIKETFDEKYKGHPMFDENIKNKVKNTCLERYGGYPAQSEEVRNKTIQTNINRYGGHPSQTPEVMEKIVRTSKSYKKYKMPSGEVRNIQGYEYFALEILLKEYNEEQIKTERIDMPIINYTFNDKTKRYFPDIYIPDKKLIIEVKSEWIYNKQLDLNKIKEKYTKEYGYNYEVWIFDRKGNRINYPEKIEP